MQEIDNPNTSGTPTPPRRLPSSIVRSVFTFLDLDTTPANIRRVLAKRAGAQVVDDTIRLSTKTRRKTRTRGVHHTLETSGVFSTVVGVHEIEKLNQT